jgi:glycosyltransferase involved in cell wall biosynthesis
MSVQKVNAANHSAKAPVLVIAPHLLYPTREGSDIAIDRRWGELSKYVSGVDIIAAQAVVRYRNGQITKMVAYRNQTRAKWKSALRTVFLRSVYTRERFLTKSFVDAAKPYLGNDSYQAVIFSYLASAPLSRFLHDPAVKRYILTHNDDVAIYQNMGKSSRNIVQKLVAIMSERWVRGYGRANKNAFRFIHVTEDDASGWTAAIGEHQYCLGKVGCNLPERRFEEKAPMSQRPMRLIFVGTLGVKMNFDAIHHFADSFLPTLLANLGPVDVRIVGSNPSPAVKTLCERNGFEMFADVSDDDLATHFAWADFSMLPFPYSTGTKLKLLDSIARGVPILATGSIGKFDGIGTETACLVSDEPDEWAAHIRKWKTTDIVPEIRDRLVATARGWTWEAMAKQFYEFELAQ